MGDLIHLPHRPPGNMGTSTFKDHYWVAPFSSLKPISFGDAIKSVLAPIDAQSTGGLI